MVTQRTWLAGTVVPGTRVWTGPSHLARSRPKAEASLLWLTELTPTPMALYSPFLSRDRIWLGETEAIFCLDQIIFLSCALANQVPSGPSTGTCRFPGKQYQGRNQASAETWRQKPEEVVKVWPAPSRPPETPSAFPVHI